jgi:hypothetical protein
MDPISELILFIARQLGLSPVATAMLIPTIILVSRTITRAIPDTAGQPWKTLRIITQYIGIYVKDNSGVAGVLTRAGNVVRQADPMDIPEDVEQGVLELTGNDVLGDPFKRGNDALNRRSNP